MQDQSIPPGRRCPTCGGRKSYPAAQCRACHNGPPKNAHAGHLRAWRNIPLGDRCEYEGCPDPPLDRHHVDGDATNNAPSNILRLCRRHHMMLDGRLAELAERAPTLRKVGNPNGRRKDAPRDVRGRYIRDGEGGA